MKHWTKQMLRLGSLSLALLTYLGQPVWAGHWNISLTSKTGGDQYSWHYTPYFEPPYDAGLTQGGSGTFEEHDGTGGMTVDTFTPFVNGAFHEATTPLVVLTWQRSFSTDDPPKVVYYVETASAEAHAWKESSNNAMEPLACTATVDNGGGMGGANLASYPETETTAVGKVQHGRYLNQVKVAADTVVLPSRTMTADTQVASYLTGGGAFGGMILYGVQIANVSLSASIARGTLIVNKPDYQEWDATVKRDYKLNDNGDALVPFWSGAGVYTVTADSLFPNQQYQWSVAGPGQPYIPAPHTADEALAYLPDGSTPTKNFTLDFGKSNECFTKDSTVTANITGDNAQKVGPLKVLVHWHLPPGITLSNIQSPPPEPLPDDEQAQIDQQISNLENTDKTVVRVGAKGVELGLRGYVEGAKFLILGAGGEVFGVMTEGGTVIEGGDALLQGDALAQKIKALDAAQDLTEVKVSVDPIVTGKATAAFSDATKLTEMTAEERELAAAYYEAVGRNTASKAIPIATRLYQDERAKFLRGQVDHIAKTVWDFMAEKGLPRE